MIGASIVATAVRVSDSARLAPEIYAITLDASPLGEQPTSITPAAISGGRPPTETRPYPTNGIIVNCNKRPIKTPFGILITFTKSRKLMAVPIPNMIMINRGMINDLVWNDPIAMKISGKDMAAVTAAKISKVNANPLVCSFFAEIMASIRNNPISEMFKIIESKFSMKIY